MGDLGRIGVLHARTWSNRGGLPAPAAAQQDLWSGVWTVGSQGSSNYGDIKLDLKDDGETITGRYAFSGGGRLTASLNRPYGPTMCGSYKDELGRGKFCATLQSDTASFQGWYKPCRILCRKREWHGNKAWGA